MELPPPVDPHHQDLHPHCVCINDSNDNLMWPAPSREGTFKKHLSLYTSEIRIIPWLRMHHEQVSEIVTIFFSFLNRSNFTFLSRQLKDHDCVVFTCTTAYPVQVCLNGHYLHYWITKVMVDAKLRQNVHLTMQVDIFKNLTLIWNMCWRCTCFYPGWNKFLTPSYTIPATQLGADCFSKCLLYINTIIVKICHRKYTREQTYLDIDIKLLKVTFYSYF